jgi:hypothetical protein
MEVVYSLFMAVRNQKMTESWRKKKKIRTLLFRVIFFLRGLLVMPRRPAKTLLP